MRVRRPKDDTVPVKEEDLLEHIRNLYVQHKESDKDCEDE